MDNIGMSRSVQEIMATLELQYFKAVSLYRRRNYEKCVEVCNAMLHAGQKNNVQMFTAPPASDFRDDDNNDDGNADNNVGTTNIVYSHYNNKNNNNNNNNYMKNIKSNSVSYRSNMGNMGSNSISRYGSNLQRIAPRHNVGPWQKFEKHNIAGASGGFDATTGGKSNNNNNKKKQKVVMPTWMMEGVWQLKMRALMQRVYIDDLETNDIANEGKFMISLFF